MMEFIELHRNFIFNTLPNFLQNKWTLMIFNIIIFTCLVKIANFFIEKFMNNIGKYKEEIEFKKQLITLKSIVKSIIDTIIIGFGTMYVLNGIGVDIRPILTAAGVLGVAVGFGAKRFFEDIISGLGLILEGQVRVGDYIEISGHEGTVEKVDIRLIQLRDLKGCVHYIRNGMVDTIVNYTREFSYYVFDIGVSYNEDPDRVANFFQELTVKLYTKLTGLMGSTDYSSAYTLYNDKQMKLDYTDYTTRIAEAEADLNEKMDRYYQKFAAMESAMAQLQNQQNSFTSMLG